LNFVLHRLVADRQKSFVTAAAIGRKAKPLGLGEPVSKIRPHADVAKWQTQRT
jgi:hypothetical protein